MEYQFLTQLYIKLSKAISFSRSYIEIKILDKLSVFLYICIINTRLASGFGYAHVWRVFCFYGKDKLQKRT